MILVRYRSLARRRPAVIVDGEFWRSWFPAAGRVRGVAAARADGGRTERCQMSRVDVDGVGIEYEVTGEGRPVVLLHGFPDSGRLWRHQVPALAQAGFQVIVPDLRGYGRSGKPEPAESYSLPLLAADVLAVLADAGTDRAHVVGHDWGAALAWTLAVLSPGSVDHLVTLSVGNPVTFRRTTLQCEKSWYMLLFQFPGIAERW